MIRALEIVTILQNNGFYALFVGGCVRDSLLGLEPKDYDIVTSASPEQVESLFINTISVGKAFGVIVVDCHYEVATFRLDNYTKTNDLTVKLLNNKDYSLEYLVQLDSSKRDLTCNAIYFDPVSAEYYNPQGGIEDLSNRKLRFVGDLEERCIEDPIRILRFFRFAIQYNLYQSSEELKLVSGLGHLLLNVSKERIFKELTKILYSINPSSRGISLELPHILNIILPELSVMKSTSQNPKHHPEGNVWNHTVLALEFLNVRTPETLWAALLHDVGKIYTTRGYGDNITSYDHETAGSVEAERILKMFKCSNKLIKEVSYLVQNHMRIKACREMKVAKVARLVLNEYFNNLKEVSLADSLAGKGDITWWSWLTSFEERTPYKNTVTPLVTGHDLILAGKQPNESFKGLLKKAFDIQLEYPTKSKEVILKELL